MSNLIPITRIYDIYPKYTYSNDVKKFMDEIVDIDRANVFTKADMIDILNKIEAEIANHLQIMDICDVKKVNGVIVQSELVNRKVVLYDSVMQIIDKYKVEGSE